MDRKTTLNHFSNLSPGDTFCLTLGKYRLRIIYFLSFKDGDENAIFFDGTDSMFFTLSNKVRRNIGSLQWSDDEKIPPLDYIEQVPQRVLDALLDALQMLGRTPIQQRDPFSD